VLTTILDTTALITTGIDGVSPRPAQLTFAIARHACADPAQIFNTPSNAPGVDCPPSSELHRLRGMLATASLRLNDGLAAEQRLGELRRMYEPSANALAGYLRVTLPPWLPPGGGFDSWQTSAWGRISTRSVEHAVLTSLPYQHF